MLSPVFNAVLNAQSSAVVSNAGSAGLGSLVRAQNTDFSNGELVGSEGGTFTNSDTSKRPVLTDGEVVFDYDDVLTLDWIGNLEGKTLFIVADVQNCGDNNDTLFGLSATGTETRVVTRTGNGNFQPRIRSSGMGLPNFSEVRSQYNVPASTRFETAIFSYTFTASGVVASHAAQAAQFIPYVGGSRDVTQITIGNAEFRTAPMKFKELRIIDSVDNAEVNVVLDELSTLYGAPYAPATDILGHNVVIFGDSIAKGFLSASGSGSSLDRFSVFDLLSDRYLSHGQLNAVNGSYIAPTDDAAEGARNGSFAYVSVAMESYPENCKAVFFQAGVNDYRLPDAQPTGTIADKTRGVSTYGDIQVAIDNVRSAIGTKVPIIFVGAHYYGGSNVGDSSAEELYTGDRSMGVFRQAQIDVAAINDNVFFVDVNAANANGGPMNTVNFGTYSSDRLHPNALGHQEAYDIGEAAFAALFVVA